MNIKNIAKKVIVDLFSETEEFFNTTWDFLFANYEKICNLNIERKQQIGGVLSIVGNEQKPAVVGVLLFVDAAKTIPVALNPEELISTIREAGNKFNAQEKLMKEMYAYIKKAIPETGHKHIEIDKEYVVWERKRGKYSASLEEINNIKKDKTIILLVDEDERIYIKGKDSMDFFKQKYSILAVLRFLVKNRGSASLVDVFDVLKNYREKEDNNENISAKRSLRHINNTLKLLSVKDEIFQCEKDSVFTKAEAKICFIVRKDANFKSY